MSAKHSLPCQEQFWRRTWTHYVMNVVFKSNIFKVMEENDNFILHKHWSEWDVWEMVL